MGCEIIPDKIHGISSLDQEIRAVVRSLCQGTTDEQRRTLQRYFTKDASFVHPFCAVPHFHERHFPLIGHLSSRDVVRGIFQWYRMLSPKIEIEIDTVCTLIMSPQFESGVESRTALIYFR